MSYGEDNASKALRITMDHMIANCATSYRGQHMCLRKLSKITKKDIRVSNKPLSLMEYVALTETNDVDQDWKRFKSHPDSTRVTHKDILSDYPQFTRLWEVDTFFPDTDVEDWMSMFVRLVRDIPFMMSPETGLLTPFQSPKFKGLLYVVKLLVEQGFDNWNQTGYFISYRSWNDHFFGLIEQTGYMVPYEVYSKAMNCQVCIAALIEETNVFTSLNCSDVILRVGPDWTARLIIQCGDESNLEMEDILIMFSKDQKMIDTYCVDETQLDIRCNHGSALFVDGLPSIRLLTLWALGLLPSDLTALQKILCHKDCCFLASIPQGLPPFSE
jgi:hypothetical protein